MIKLNEIKFIEYRVDDENEWNELMQKLNDIEMDKCDNDDDSFKIENVGEISGYMGNFTTYVNDYDGLLIGYSWNDDDLRIIAISEQMQRMIDGD